MAEKPRQLSIARRSARSTKPSLRLREILFVDFETDEAFHTTMLGSYCRIPDPEKRIQHCFDSRGSVELDAPLRQFHWKRSGMRAFLAAALDRLIGDEPRIPAATPVPSAGVSPSSDVALVGIRDAQSQTIDRRPAFPGEMKNVFVAIVEIPRRADRLEMATRSRAAGGIIDRDRLDPMDGILEDEQIAQVENELMGKQRV